MLTVEVHKEMASELSYQGAWITKPSRNRQGILHNLSVLTANAPLRAIAQILRSCCSAYFRSLKTANSHRNHLRENFVDARGFWIEQEEEDEVSIPIITLRFLICLKKSKAMHQVFSMISPYNRN